jgi:nitrous oxidase accessory protein NosD
MTIQDALSAAMPGDTVTIPAGVYDVSDLSLPPNVTLYAPDGATIIGNLHVRGPNTVVQGFTFAGGMVDLGNSQGATIRDCVFNGGEASITFDGAADAHIANNDFNNVAGGAVTGWGLNQSTISGNHFVNCTQGIDLNFNNDPTRGLDIVVEQNTFTNTARMPIEVGPGGAYTSNLIIRGNWSDNSNLSNPAADGGVAYSIISTNGVNTLIEGNYAKGPPGPGIGIEMDGSGEIKNNYIDTFEFGIIVFGSGFNVHDNTVVNTPLGAVVNYSGRDGIIENNLDQLAPALVTDAVGNGGSGAGNLALLTNYLASTFVTAAGEGTGAVVAAQSSDQEFLAKPMA